jgi:hypothetical protein
VEFVRKQVPPFVFAHPVLFPGSGGKNKLSAQGEGLAIVASLERDRQNLFRADQLSLGSSSGDAHTSFADHLSRSVVVECIQPPGFSGTGLGAICKLQSSPGKE